MVPHVTDIKAPGTGRSGREKLLQLTEDHRKTGG
jgi:hypothetical protein